jgi:broad specificity phosphatase PhoE
MSDALPMIYLVRHGATAWTQTGQHTGRTDLALNEQGEREARQLGERLSNLRFDHILSSPLVRARRTAELVLGHTRIEADEDLTEWDHGAYEGRRTVDIQSDRPGWNLFRDGCPGGETIDAIGARADRVVDRIRSTRGNVLVFAHREILRVLAARWIGLAPIEGRCLLLTTASLSLLGYHHDLSEPAIHSWNSLTLSSNAGRFLSSASTPTSKEQT